MRFFTVVDEFYPIPPKLAEKGSIQSSNGIHFKYHLGLTVFDFYSRKSLIVPDNINGKLSKQKKREKEAYDYIKKAMADDDIVIEDGKFLRGSEEELKKYNMVLIK